MAFDFKLENPTGRPQPRQSSVSAVPSWRPGDVIPLGPSGKALRVVKVQFSEDPAEDPILVVESVGEA